MAEAIARAIEMKEIRKNALKEEYDRKWWGHKTFEELLAINEWCEEVKEKIEALFAIDLAKAADIEA